MKPLIIIWSTTMTIAGFKPTVVLGSNAELPKIVEDGYKGIVYSDDAVALSSLIGYVEGSPWSVTYYNQVLGDSNDARELDAGQLDIYQQYTKIDSLEIRVNTTLAPSFDSTTGITSVTGTAICYGMIFPNVADYFTATIADGKTGLFRITDVQRKTFNRDSVFSIDYDLVGYTDVLTDLINSLGSKVIREYTFSKDRMMDGQNPLLTTTVEHQVTNLGQLYTDIVTTYFRTFFNPRFMTVMVPGQEESIYDGYLVDYLLKIVDISDSPEIVRMKQHPTDNDVILHQPQFWDILLTKDYNGLKYCNQNMGLLRREMFNHNPTLKGVGFWNVNYRVYPIVADATTIVGLVPFILNSTDVIVEVCNRFGQLPSVVNNAYNSPTGPISIIKPVTYDVLYVLSEFFYDPHNSNNHPSSILELTVMDYLMFRPINLTSLYTLCYAFRDWGRLEQYYYGPILLTLIKEAQRGVY